MENNEGALEYTLRVLRRRKLLILIVLVIVPVVAFVYSSMQTKEYTATATLLYESQEASPEASREAATNEALAALPTVAVMATEELGPPTTLEEVLGGVKVVSANEQANLTSIEATNQSPEQAAKIANAYANAYIVFRRESDRSTLKKSIAIIEGRLADLSSKEAQSPKGELLRERLNQLEVEEALQTGHVTLVQEAGPPTSPSKPRKTRNVVLGLLVGLVLGLALAAIVERLDKRIRTTEELAEIFELPIVARIPKTKNFRRASVGRMLNSPEAESLRGLRSNLRYLKQGRDLSRILIASPEPNDGKSTVARGLAGAMAEMGDKVILVEADLHKESAFRREVPGPLGGLSGVLAGQPLDRALTSVVVSTGAGPVRTLTVLPSGPLPPNPSELLESDRMVALLDELSERFETVIIDSPAIGIVSDAMALVPNASAILAVGGVGKTTRDAARRFVVQVSLTGNRPIGLVATLTSAGRSQYSYYRQSMVLSRR